MNKTGIAALALILTGLASHAAGAQTRRAAFAQAKLLPRLCAGRHPEQRLAVNRRHFDLRAERRFRHSNRHYTVDIIAAPLEVRMIADVRGDQQVAGWAAILAGVAFAGDAHPRAGFNACRDAGRDRFALRGDAYAVTA